MANEDLEISQAGLDLIKSFEGLRLKAYQDSIGKWTIGYGTIMYPDGSHVQEGDTCTEEQAEEYLQFKLKVFEDDIKKFVTVELNQNRFDSLVDLLYNIGPGNFATSTLLKLINAGKFDDASAQFLRWNRAGGRVIDGLTRRRQAEMDLFNS